ncbi:MAG: glutamine--fructose-6-phosphate transaminase (isomerizing) [Betaproteobacteria bacterium]|nr:glutamine--fructose-6-phosphate transaminase (isomerizing) [Betaproteobacteria bacterium]MDE2422760.1 glutamine--fructose-6-phosphate transaminase (isomerizing) [Betaproteobacteria bacterium]
MCGIVGAISQRNVVPVLIEGLKRLEYRGYDSAGLAVIDNHHLSRVRSTGRVKQLEEEVLQHQVKGSIGIAHTRWATHGIPSERNAHPHVSQDGLAVVHNGIIENYEELRHQLQSSGYQFTSETDTEVIAHLIHSFYRQHHNLLLAVRESLARLEGAYAIAVMVEDKPGELIAARLGSPLLIGLADDGYFLASDASALISVTQTMLYLEEGDVVELTHNGYQISNTMGERVERPIHTSELSADNVELGPYQHYMQKEIAEQPRAITDTVEKILGLGFNPTLFGDSAQQIFSQVKGVIILACGTSYHAGLVARYWLEHITKLPCVVEVASEYRYRISVPQTDYLVVTISQSGETADTQAALKHAKSLGHRHTLTICNVPESALIRQSELAFLTRAGMEIGVASTKAFTTQLVALFSLAVVIAKCQDRLSSENEREYLDALRRLPNKIQHVLNLEPQLQLWADRFAQKDHVLFLGRGIHYPIALEGSLKLKEISYIHAEAYPAGELKHGPLALVDERMPVIAVAPNDNLLEKLKSNLQEVKARGGVLYVIADNDSHFKAEEGIHVIRMPDHEGILSPIMHVVPLQLLAYHVACQRGTDVDKPRNLAKSVTVE